MGTTTQSSHFRLLLLKSFDPQLTLTECWPRVDWKSRAASKQRTIARAPGLPAVIEAGKGLTAQRMDRRPPGFQNGNRFRYLQRRFCSSDSLHCRESGGNPFHPQLCRKPCSTLTTWKGRARTGRWGFHIFPQSRTCLPPSSKSPLAPNCASHSSVLKKATLRSRGQRVSGEIAGQALKSQSPPGNERVEWSPLVPRAVLHGSRHSCDGGQDVYCSAREPPLQKNLVWLS